MTEATLSALVWEGDRAPLAKALVAAQKATEAVKKAKSNSHFGSKYAELADVVEAVTPALNEAGVAVLQFPAFDGQMVAVTTTFLHESGSSVTSTLHLRPSKPDPQGEGSAITYGRRYALLAMSGAAPEDDDGNAASAPQKGTSNPAGKDYGPSSPGADFPGAEGAKGKSSYAAKKDGTAARFKELQNEIWGLESLAACTTWANERLTEILAMPEGWRKELRATLETQRADISAAEADGSEDDTFPGDVDPAGASGVAGADRELAGAA